MEGKPLKSYEFWLIAGSQSLYGKETLDEVSQHSRQIATSIECSSEIPCTFIYKSTVKSSEEALSLIKEANHNDNCAGIVVWMHTFSPSKMWIHALQALQKPYCHLHTQYYRNIPNMGIDMDFMNTNQSAHGDREHGFIAARMHIARKLIVGYWEDADVHRQLGSWMRSAVGAVESRRLKIVRFGDNMRQVAVTEGDKVGVQMQLGWQVNTWGVGDLVSELDMVTERDIDEMVARYTKSYVLDSKDMDAIRYQAREEIAMQRFLEREGAAAFTNTFEDLQQMRQLPGLATQDLMAKGYGYGGEGDWKTAAMTTLLVRMTTGMTGGTSFMEDYVYDLEPGEELTLGAHMLEVSPVLASDTPRIEVHPLGIGGKEPPARLVFEGHPGPAIVASLVDMGGRLRLVVQDIEVVKPKYTMPNLPVARLMWRSFPDMKTGAKMWILAGGAHHTTLSFDASAEMLGDWAEIMDIEFVHISKESTFTAMKQQLFLSDLAWRLRM